MARLSAIRLFAPAAFLICTLFVGRWAHADGATPARPQGPCDIYTAAGAPCTAAHSTTRALFAAYNGPLYQVLRQSDGKTLDIGVVQPSASDAGGYANAAAQDAFCADTFCWITTIYDQSGHRNNLTQAPRGAFSGSALGGFNNLPIADMAPLTIMGHKAYGVFIAPGMGLRTDDPTGTAVDDQAEGQYWVVNGRHYNSGCCFDYGNAEIDSRDDDEGTMETTYFGNAPYWFHGDPPGPWVMTDQENNLVGCANPDGSKLCPTLPNITWRFVTGIAKGEPHHWTSMGGDAQHGALAVMFNGPRVNGLYDPMRKQGAILLGNGGDNSNGSQGTFYEGAMTAGGTFPSDATDQSVQANIVAAGYAAAPLTLNSSATSANPSGLQTFALGGSGDATLTFTNTASTPAADVALSLRAPPGWVVAPAHGSAAQFASVAPGASVSATFDVTSNTAAFNGDLVGLASWSGGGRTQTATTVEKVRNVGPVRINEFRISDGSSNTSNSFIELYNPSTRAVDISNWTLTQHAAQQAIFGSIAIPAGTRLAAHGVYLLGLSNSGLAAAAHAGDSTIFVRNAEGLKPGDAITIASGAGSEMRHVARVGSAASAATTLWQPLPDGPIITIPVGSTNVPVSSTAGFQVGEKIALGHGATYPAVGLGVEQFEVATVTAIGKPGTQSLLAANAAIGATNIKVRSVEYISVGDEIRLDIDSHGHGIETVRVAAVGTAAQHSVLTEAASAGATSISVRSILGFTTGARLHLATGDKINVGTPGNMQTVTVTGMTDAGPGVATVFFRPALAAAHIQGEDVMEPGTGLTLAAPLKFNHASNLPFSDPGTGVSFSPATAFAHSSNEPVQALGAGVVLDQPLGHDHPVDAMVRDASVAAAGYRGGPAPNLWFGGPALSANGGAMVLRDATNIVVDSLNYGGVIDPWAAEGYQGASGLNESGCYIAAPGVVGGWPIAASVATDTSARRATDGNDTDSNCADFQTPPATTLQAPAASGAVNVKVASVARFTAGQTLIIDTGANRESALIATVGTAGAALTSATVTAGATTLAVVGPNARSFHVGDAISVDVGANQENATVASAGFRRGGGYITITAPLSRAHATGAQVSGSGITLAAALAHAHSDGAQVTTETPTPGRLNATAH